jgi:hypothetical protein
MPLNQTPAARSLVEIGAYAVESFLMSPFNESVARALGTLITHEDARMTAGSATWPTPPSRVQAMTDHIVDHLDAPLTIADIARVGECSTATAERLFRVHKGSSLKAWVRSAGTGSVAAGATDWYAENPGRRTRPAPLDGPYRGVLGQRGRRVVLVNVQERVLPPARVPHHRRCPPWRLRLDRRLVQRPPPTLQHRLPQPTTVRSQLARQADQTALQAA